MGPRAPTPPLFGWSRALQIHFWRFSPLRFLQFTGRTRAPHENNRVFSAPTSATHNNRPPRVPQFGSDGQCRGRCRLCQRVVWRLPVISALPAAQPDLDRIHSGPPTAIVPLGWRVSTAIVSERSRRGFRQMISSSRPARLLARAPGRSGCQRGEPSDSKRRIQRCEPAF